MVAWLLILGFAISSSLDNLGVGISYGIRGIRINYLSNLIIAVICFILSLTGIISGQWLAKVLPGVLPVLIGALLLFIVGVRIILLAVPRKEQESSQDGEGAREVASDGSLKGILHNPETVDKDKSGSIGYLEAAVLGIALAANAVTNGIGAGLMGLSPLAISLTAAIGSYITVWLGVILGQKVSAIRTGSFTLGQFSTVLSGIIIILIACKSFFG
ncbi:sporulation membrane protein YtaF [Paenibacillus sp. CMAA1739]|uniref:sporulation membrane protein YtaF n=1 Tax=Paenibacillus ottowii TaxID=2315729 RepID=UPI002DB83247|nr:sporulation membrane protein YtaF [Paenibacillus sp. CMAA1739]MEC4568767.1 sporulation membrane protein YtaF [Paenibacillus sp. CMAA1739]